MNVSTKKTTYLLSLFFITFMIFSCSDDDKSRVLDSDNDGVANNIDNCINTANPNQEDIDGDGIGDVCDTINNLDTDNDGINNETDNCPNIANPNQEDIDGDGIGDVCDAINDIDLDNDGVLNEQDNCPNTANPNQEDINGNGIGDICEVSQPLAICQNGFAGQYPCDGYDLMGHIPINVLASTQGNPEGSDIWGWTDPTTGKEYAIVGTTNSTAFVDVTDPINPEFLGRVNTNAGTNFWRDVKVYNNHAFIVADVVGNHGMQVFDLTRLRNVANPPQTFNADAIFNGVGSCHNIVINETEAVAYLVGCTSTNGGGPIFVDISNPTNPTFINDYTEAGYTHDAQVVTYNGPDMDYTGREIYIGSNGNTDKVVILDVTDKNNVVLISDFTYPQTAYAHQGWFTDDQRYFILGDEQDEQNFGFNSKTIIFDFNDLDNPILSSTYLGTTPAIDHNGYVKGDEFFLANYRAGLRVLDISNISSTTNPMTEIGYFDTYPSSNSANFNGVWSVYPYFASGNIMIGDIEGGLFIIRKSGT